MTEAEDPELLRVADLLRIAARELVHLRTTDRRLFAGGPVGPELADRLETDQALAERLDAFVARFGRLQDTLGARLLPATMRLLGDAPGAMLENLDWAERLGLVRSADAWAEIRRLRNRMIHEYVSDPAALADALNRAHAFIPDLERFLEAVRERLLARFPMLRERLGPEQPSGRDERGKESQ